MLLERHAQCNSEYAKVYWYRCYTCIRLQSPSLTDFKSSWRAFQQIPVLSGFCACLWYQISLFLTVNIFTRPSCLVRNKAINNSKIFSINHPIKTYLKVNLWNFCLFHGVASIKCDISEFTEYIKLIFLSVTRSESYKLKAWFLETNSTKIRDAGNSRQATVLKV